MMFSPMVLLDFCPKKIFVSNFFPMRCPIVRLSQKINNLFKWDTSLKALESVIFVSNFFPMRCLIVRLSQNQ